MYLPSEKLMDLLKTYENECNKLREDIAEICYVMKGGVDYDSAWGMSFEDREILIKVINRHLKASNPNGKEYM
jgi:hypothetical protein